MGKRVLRTHLGILLLAVTLASAGMASAQDTNTFTVTVEDKTDEHPFAGQGFSQGYVVDGEQGKTLTLVRGQTYTFQMDDVPSIHPFYLTTSIVGEGAEPYSEGVEGNGATDNETLTFTPDASTPDTMYYNCTNHAYMGGLLVIQDTATGTTEANEAEIPSDLSLDQNYPNPFNPSTMIRFGLDAPSRVELVVYDVAGREVRRLAEGILPAGWHTATWDGTDGRGRRVASGTYVYRLQAGSTELVRTMVLLK